MSGNSHLEHQGYWLWKPDRFEAGYQTRRVSQVAARVEGLLPTREPLCIFQPPGRGFDPPTLKVRLEKDSRPREPSVARIVSRSVWIESR